MRLDKKKRTGLGPRIEKTNSGGPLGDLLRTTRVKLNMTLSDVQFETRLSNLSTIEFGKKYFPTACIKQTAIVLGLNEQDLTKLVEQHNKRIRKYQNIMKNSLDNYYSSKYPDLEE